MSPKHVKGHEGRGTSVPLFYFAYFVFMRCDYQKSVIQHPAMNFVNRCQFPAQINRFTHRNRIDAHCLGNLGTFGGEL